MSGAWLLSYVVLWCLVAVLGVSVLALLRQIGVLHARLSPLGTHPAGEGLPIGTRAPIAPLAHGGARLLLFTSPTCTVCRALAPGLPALGRDYPEVAVETVELGASTRGLFDAFAVRSTPYAVAVSADGIVAGGGIANSLEQLEELLRETAAAGRAHA